MKKVLITGGTGLLGRQIIECLGDYQRVVVDHYNSSLSKEQFYIDLSSDSISLSAVDSKAQYDSILYLAQSNKYKDFPDQSRDIFNVNIKSVFEFLEYGRINKINRFILASSGGVYGSGETGFTESEDLNYSNLGFYLNSKLCSEILANNYSGSFHIIILRPFFIYGPNQKEGMLIPRLIKSIVNGERIKLSGTNGIMINPIYVDDAAIMVSKTVELEESIILNIAGNEVLSIRDISETIGEIVGKIPLFTFSDKLESNIIGDISKTRSVLNYTPQTNFHDGVSHLINDMKKRGLI